MELLSDKQKRYQKNLYRYGVAIQIFSLVWLPWFLSALGFSFSIASYITVAIILFSLTATIKWYQHYAFPEKRVPSLIWYFWILPAFIFQVWCIFILPIAVINWVIALTQIFSFHTSTVVQKSWQIMGILTLAITVYGINVRRKKLCFRHHILPLNNLQNAFHGYKIVHLSDFHISNFTHSTWLQRYVQRINHWNPDLILITGDLLTYGDNFLSDLLSILKELRAKDGILLCTGNHDYYVYRDKHKLSTALSKIGIKVLENTFVNIQRNNEILTVLGISGVVDNIKIQGEFLGQALKNINSDSSYHILLAHDPTTFHISKTSIELTLAGHTHGGQLALPFALNWNLARHRYPYHSGLYQHDNNYLYVHRGIGTVALPLRIGVPPEIVFFTLQEQG